METRPREGGGTEFVLRGGDLPVRLGAIAGDLVHNVRSALDLLAWALVESRGTMPTSERDQSNVQFPIVFSEAQFTDQAKRRLPGVPSHVIADIRQRQPFVMSPAGWDESHQLGRLVRLSNSDKHRILTPTLYMSEQSSVEGTSAQADGYAWVIGQNRAISDGTVVGEAVNMVADTVKVDLVTTIAFGPVGPTATCVSGDELWTILGYVEGLCRDLFLAL